MTPDLTLLLAALLALVIVVVAAKLFGARGALGALSAVAVLFGASYAQNRRRRRLIEQFRTRETELELMETRLAGAEQDAATSETNLREARQALEAERRTFLRSVAETEAQRDAALAGEVERIDNLSTDEVLHEVTTLLGRLREPEAPTTRRSVRA